MQTCREALAQRSLQHSGLDFITHHLPHTHTPAHTLAFNIHPPPTHPHTYTGTSPFVITGLAQGVSHTFSVTPRQISNSSLPQCASRRGLIGSVLTIQL